MNNQIGIFGTSGMALEAGDIAWALGLEPVYVALNAEEASASALIGEQVILETEVGEQSGMPFVIGIGDNLIRQKVANAFRDKLRFGNLIHPSATFGRRQADDLVFCEGLIICAGARFTNHIKVGNFCIINQNATIAHDSVIDDFVHVAPGATISGNVHLESGCWIGAGATVNQGSNDKKLIVGKGALVGSGAVVISDCEPRAVYAGVPAKRIK